MGMTIGQFGVFVLLFCVYICVFKFVFISGMLSVHHEDGRRGLESSQELPIFPLTFILWFGLPEKLFVIVYIFSSSLSYLCLHLIGI